MALGRSSLQGAAIESFGLIKKGPRSEMIFLSLYQIFQNIVQAEKSTVINRGSKRVERPRPEFQEARVIIRIMKIDPCQEKGTVLK